MFGFKIKLGEPSDQASNLYEIIFSLPHSMDQVLEGTISLKTITLFCSRESRDDILKNLGLEDQPTLKINYYGEQIHWPKERTTYGLFTTPFVDFQKLADNNAHIHENKVVFDENTEARNMLGNPVNNGAFGFYFENVHLNAKLKRLREKRLVEAIIWYQQLRKAPEEVKYNVMMKLMTQVNIYPFLQMNPVTGAFIIQEQAIDDLGEEEVIIVPRKGFRG
jgi:hypothetical protein